MTNTQTELERLLASAEAAQKLAAEMVATKTEVDGGMEAVATGLRDAGKAAELAVKQQQARDFNDRLWKSGGPPEWTNPETGVSGGSLFIDANLGHLTFAGLARRLATKGRASGLGTKALLPSGTVVGETTTISDPVPQGRPLASLLDAVPVMTVTGGDYTYLRQNTRTNNAAPVAQGAQKPTSVFGLERVTDQLRVIAHLSEAVSKYWLEDDATLEQFLDAELRYGLARALETQIVTGNGTDPNLRGFANTSGTVLQAFNTDRIRTARSALTQATNLGAVGEPFFAFAPADWEAIEVTVTSGSGDYVTRGAGTPVDAVERRLWGQPVVVVPSLAAGIGWLVDPAAVRLISDGQVRVEWNTSSGFGTNTVLARCETRAALAVQRPAGIIQLDLTAA